MTCAVHSLPCACTEPSLVPLPILPLNCCYFFFHILSLCLGNVINGRVQPGSLPCSPQTLLVVYPVEVLPFEIELKAVCCLDNEKQNAAKKSPLVG